MMAVPHLHEQNSSAALLQKGGFSRAIVNPFIRRHSHIHATSNVVQTSIIGKRDLTLMRPRLRTTNQGLVTTLQAYDPKAELATLPAALLGTPASHPPHSSHRLVTTDLHARRCTNHLSCAHTRTFNLLIISSLRYNQLRPTNPAVYLRIERTINFYSTINSAFHYKN